MQAWVVTGVPPVQPEGDEVATVRVCVPSAWQAPHAEYVNAEQVVTGGTYVQVWVVTGVPPVQPEGDEVATVRVCVPSAWQAPHAEYVNAEQVVTGGT